LASKCSLRWYNLQEFAGIIYTNYYVKGGGWGGRGCTVG